MSLYTWIILGTILFPLLLSFDKKVHFYTYWKFFLPAISISGLLFIIWDEYFTSIGIWGFNPNNISGIYIGHLPLEEIVFYLVIPFVFLIIYEALLTSFPNVVLVKTAHFFAFGFTLAGLIFGISYLENWYSASACLISAFLTTWIYFINRMKWFTNFVLAFWVVLIPLIILNGFITGAFADEAIIWYKQEHIIGFRILTIPLENVFYNYALLLSVLSLYEYFKKRRNL